MEAAMSINRPLSYLIVVTSFVFSLDVSLAQGGGAVGGAGVARRRGGGESSSGVGRVGGNQDRDPRYIPRGNVSPAARDAAAGRIDRYPDRSDDPLGRDIRGLDNGHDRILQNRYRLDENGVPKGGYREQVVYDDDRRSRVRDVDDTDRGDVVIPGRAVDRDREQYDSRFYDNGYDRNRYPDDRYYRERPRVGVDAGRDVRSRVDDRTVRRDDRTISRDYRDDRNVRDRDERVDRTVRNRDRIDDRDSDRVARRDDFHDRDVRDRNTRDDRMDRDDSIDRDYRDAARNQRTRDRDDRADRDSRSRRYLDSDDEDRDVPPPPKPDPSLKRGDR